MSRQTATLVDMDGTLVNVAPIRHLVAGQSKDFDAFHRASLDCLPIFPVVDRLVKASSGNSAVVVISGREARFRRLTEFWLAMWDIPSDELVMRANGDNRPGIQIKSEMFSNLSRKFDIIEIIDDQDELLALWRDLEVSSVIDAKDLMQSKAV